MVVVKMKGVGEIVGEGNYPVVLTKVSEKKNSTGADVVTFQATIKDSDTEWDGRSLFRSFTISNDPEKDISGILYYLKMTLLAFGEDEDEMDTDKYNPVESGKKLYGNSAMATVTHQKDSRDPDKTFAAVEFMPSGF